MMLPLPTNRPDRARRSAPSRRDSPGPVNGLRALALPAVVGCVGLILGSLSPLSGAGAELPQLELFGNDRILWIYQRQPESAGAAASRLRQLAYRRADGADGDPYLPLPIEPARGRVVREAVRGLSLHAFYGDGTHRRYAPGKVSRKGTATPVQFAELSLPQAVAPAALAADAADAGLYAIVSARRAAELEPLLAEEGPEEDGGPDPPIPPLAPPRDADRMLVRYEDGRWWPDRYAPPDLAHGTDIPAMLARKGVIHLFYRADSESGPLLHRFSAGPDETWSEPVFLPLDVSPALCAGGWRKDLPVLLIAQRHDDGMVIHEWHLAKGAWIAGQALVEDTGYPARCAGPVAAAIFNDRAAVATLNEAGKPQVSLWSLENGALAEPPVPVVALIRVPPAQVSGPVRLLVQYGILAGALAAVFVWRRDRVLRAVPLPPGLAFARLPRRALALIIDLAVLLPVWGPVLFALWQREADGLAFREQLTMGARMMSTWLFWSWAIVGAIVGVYATVLEMVTRTTLGKWLTGLSVVGEDGKQCRFGTILARNLARVVEFQFLPLVVLVALTPSRQRLGDLLARTVVVERVLPGGQPGPSSNAQS